MTEYEHFGLVFTKTRVYKFGHGSLRIPITYMKGKNPFYSNYCSCKLCGGSQCLTCVLSSLLGAPYTVIRFVWVSTKFGTCTVVSVNEILIEDKMRRFKGECAHFIFNKCPIYTHDGASAKFSTNSHETNNSVLIPSLSFPTVCPNRNIIQSMYCKAYPVADTDTQEDSRHWILVTVLYRVKNIDTQVNTGQWTAMTEQAPSYKQLSGKSSAQSGVKPRFGPG